MESVEKEIGIEGFNKIFELKGDLKKEIENYKSTKTIIHLKFLKFLKDKKEYKKIRFSSLNKEISIDDKNPLYFEYINDKFPYKSEIPEEIILFSEAKESKYFITVKRHHDNYYYFCNDIENSDEKTYSLEIVFFFKDLKDSFDNIIYSNKKIVSNEKFPKTVRYNLININLNNVIKLFDDYSDNKMNQLDENQQKDLFGQYNLFFNFIYGNKKRMGKIFNIKQEKQIEDFNDEEKKF